ncbi:tripartite tricarboxylate transporter substrate binding protein [Dankookia rubra]|uniref:Tripartite tricarboxylate transporter substrate binding protein n=1 Tax=Dankookia rubra TaxID=1442381 RepID=A0A4R5QHY7_9PROT|nr:tripartite tricarboxylate transporter substrate binding protein [Dankookia rubra]TDH62970.1 tripartite tricarboxylate transporter substrate binding protein [Dankookia rubra]
MLRRTLLAAPLLATSAAAQPAWPARPIRIVNPCPAGSPDAMVRFLAERLTAALGQPVLVEGRSGAGGTIGAGLVAHAPPDGYLLGIGNLGPHAMAPATYPGLRHDPLRDVTHLALLGELPLSLAVSAAGPHADLAGFIAAGRAAPGQLRAGTVGKGTLGDLVPDLLRRETGAEFAAIPFRGGAPAIIGTLGGRIEATLASLGETGGQERLRLLAPASAARVPRFPDAPTFREAGLDLVAEVWFGLCGPAGLPAPVVARLEREVAANIRSEPYGRFLAGLGAGPHRPLDAAAWTRFVAAEGVRRGDAARAADLRAE